MILDNVPVGQTLAFKATCKQPDANGLLQFVDPGSVTLYVLAPGGATATAYPATRDTLGTYHVLLQVTLVGKYEYRWEMTNPAAGVTPDGTINVAGTNVTGS